jgi:hypothetical protein
MSFGRMFESLDAKASRRRLLRALVSTERFAAARNTVDEHLAHKLLTGVASSVLRTQLTLHTVGTGETFQRRTFIYDPFEIYLVIEEIENGNEALCNPFNRRYSLLKGLFHAHHSKTYFIGTNAGRQWRKAASKMNLSDGDYMLERQRRMKEELLARGFSPEQAEEQAPLSVVRSQILAVYSEPYDLKGEWLIIAKHNGRHYFLCLGWHDESELRLLHRIKRCRHEFPFLGGVLPSQTETLRRLIARHLTNR